MDDTSTVKRSKKKIVEEEEAPKKRSWESWSATENNAFFIALRENGRDFDKLTAQVGTKNRDQVRDYYYRLVKKVSAILNGVGYTLDKKNLEQVLHSLLCFWQLKQKIDNEGGSTKSPDKNFANALLELVQLTEKTTTVMVTGQHHHQNGAGVGGTGLGIPIGLPRKRSLHQFDDEENEDDEEEENEAEVRDERAVAYPNGIPIDPMPLQQYDFAEDPLHNPVYPEKITLQLKPKSITVSESLKRSGYNTVINLTFKPTKSIASIIQHLQKKWVRVINGIETSIASSFIRLYPCLKPEQEGNTILSPAELERGWGIESGVTVLQIYQQLGFPQPFQLQYWWNSENFIMPHVNNDVSNDVMSQNVIGNISQLPIDESAKLPRNMHQMPPKQVSLVNSSPYKIFKKIWILLFRMAFYPLKKVAMDLVQNLGIRMKNLVVIFIIILRILPPKMDLNILILFMLLKGNVYN